MPPRTGKTLVALTSLLDIGNELASGLSPTLIICSAGHTWKVSDGRRTKILGHSLYLTRSFQDELCLHLPQLKQYYHPISSPGDWFEYEKLRKSGDRTAMILDMRMLPTAIHPIDSALAQQSI
jgi:hypothetical protein